MTAKPQRPSTDPAADAFELDEDHLTPLEDVVERLEVSKGFVLSTRDIALVRAMHEESADRLMRSRQRRISPSPYCGTEIERRIDALEDFRIELVGIDGKNGKVGTLKERIDKAEARRWQVLMALLAMVLTLGGSAIAFGSWMGSIETDVETLKRRNSSPPDYPAPKETQP